MRWNKLMNQSKLTEMLFDAVADYAAHASVQNPDEWLQEYLGKTLSSKTIDVIHVISEEIIDTLNLMENKKNAMNAAVDKGQSAENWFSSDVMNESGSNGEKARRAAEFFNGIYKAQSDLEDVVETDWIEIDEDSKEWQDDNWNDYKLKDTLKEIAKEVGKTGMKEIASDLFLKASEEGIASVLSDKAAMQDILLNGADIGLKVAVSAGLAVAEESGIIPVTSFQVLATTAHKTVESMTAIGEVIKGKLTMTEALVRIKNTAISTFSGMWKQHKNKMADEIVDVVGNVYGMKGAVIAGAVSGLVIDTNSNESRLTTVLKEAGKAAIKFLTKERTFAIFSKNKKLKLNADSVLN